MAEYQDPNCSTSQCRQQRRAYCFPLSSSDTHSNQGGMEVRRRYIVSVCVVIAITWNLYYVVTNMDTKPLGIPSPSPVDVNDMCQTLLQEVKSGRQTIAGPKVTQWWQAAALIFWYIVSPVEYKCAGMKAVGNWHVCQDKRYLVKPPCLVYSFGIANDFSFDDAMGSIGCEVHSFDPSMNKSDHVRSKNVTFHNMGLSGIDSDTFQARKDSYVKKSQKWKIRTLKTIMKELGHSNRVLDVLKIDVEGHEWAVVKNILEDGLFSRIRQFYLEWHLFSDWPAKSTYVSLYELYTQLERSGLIAFRKSPHPHTFTPKEFNVQGDVNYVNANFTQTAI